MKSRPVFALRCSLLLFLLSITSALAAETGTAKVRHAPAITGTVDGSVQQMTGESATLNGGAVITGDWLVPGSPTARLNGHPTFAGTTQGQGSATPTGYQITLNGGASLGHLVLRTDPVSLGTVTAPAQPAGTRVVTINASSDSPGSVSTLRNLTLNGNVGQFAIPGGNYGDFTANGGSGFTLGVAGAVQPTVYGFQHLTLNGQAKLQVLGPVIINLANGFTANGVIGTSSHPAWITINVYSGGVTVNGAANIYGYVSAPNGTVIVNGNSQLTGGVVSDRLTVNGGGMLRLILANSNHVPVAFDRPVQLAEDTTAPILLTASDADGNSLTYSVVTNPAHGQLSGVAPNLTYTPAPNYNGPDSFTFEANDGVAASNVATISLTVTPVNDAPVANSQSVSLDEDASVPVVVSGADVDGDALTFSVSLPPSHGQLTGTAPNLTYTPDPNYNGSDTFTYTAFDGQLTSSAATVSLVINPVNDAPVALNQTLSVSEGSGVQIALSATDVDSPASAITFTLTSTPANGTLSGSAGTYVYSPRPNFGGVDTFTFTASDGQLTSAPATITINVTNLNFAPVAAAGSATTNEDTPTPLSLTATDQDNDTLSFSVVTGPQHGSLGTITASGTSAAVVVYTPAKDYNGSDSFTFKANDGKADSAVVTFSLAVQAVNDAPTAIDQTVQLDEDRPVTLTLAATDVDSATLTFHQVTGPAHGMLGPIVVGPDKTASVTYTPAKDYSGSDSFTFKAGDGSLDSAPATVSLTIHPVNDAPTVEGQTLQAVEDVPLTITLSGADVDSPSLTFHVVTPPVHGTLSPLTPATDTTATLVYTPNRDYNGEDGFVVAANDGTTDSEPATIALTVTPVNDPPVADGGPILAYPQDTPINFTLAATDAEHDPLAFTIVTPPQHGSLSGTAPNLTYTPNFNYRGDDTLVFRANDGQADSNDATVTFRMVPVAHAPTVQNATASTDEDTPKMVVLSATDADGDPLTCVIVAQPLHGALTPVATPSGALAAFLYTPDKDYNGADTFTFRAYDGGLYSDVATVALTIAAVNDAPIGSAISISPDEDTSVIVTLTATDSENDPLTYAIVTPPSHGTLTQVTANSYAYTPQANYNGSDSFTFTATDGLLTSIPATVNLSITPVNDAPTATAQSLEAEPGKALSIILTGNDVDGDMLSYVVVSPPAHGTLDGTAPNLTYIANSGYVGGDTITFKANDGRLDSAPALISLSVRSPGAPPPLSAGGERTVVAATATRNHPGTVLVNSDEWTFSDQGFSLAPSAAMLARNLANWFRLGSTGRFLVYSNDFGLLGQRFRDTIRDAGHVLTIDTSIPPTAAILAQYDGVFLDALAVDPAILNTYVQQGGNVYICGRGSSNDAGLWNSFLAAYGMSFSTSDNPVVGAVTVSSGHPLLQNVSSIYYYNGTTLNVAPGTGVTNTEVLHETGGFKLLVSATTGRFSATVEGQFLSMPPDFDPSTVTYNWSTISGPGPIRFASRNAKATVVYVDTVGDYRVRLTATNAKGSSSADVLLHLIENQAPRVNAGSVIRVPSSTQSVLLSGTITDPDVPATGPLTSKWSVVQAPEGATVQFTPEAGSVTTAKFSNNGRYLLALTGSDGVDTTSAVVEARVGTAMQPLPPGAVAWWPFDGAPFDVIHDGHSVRGALYGGGKVLEALRTLGGDLPTTPAHSDLDIGASAGGLSVEFWFKSDQKADETFVAYYGGGKRGLIVHRDWYGGQRLSFRIYDSNGGEKSIQTGDTFMGTSVPWTHVAATYDRNTGVARLYINGVVATSSNWGNVAAQTLKDVYFGNSPDNTGGLVGELDEVTFYNRPLSGAEVAAIYQAGADGKAPQDGNTAPTVNGAGGIQIASAGAATTLPDLVVDDGFPFGAPLSTWSQLAGPGTVQFSADAAGKTIATFPVAGMYLLKLSGSDQYAAPVSGVVEVRVATAVLPLPGGIAAWWPLNGTARDVVHDSHEADLLNGVSYDVGEVGTGFRFNGVNQQATVAAHPDLDIGSSTAGFAIEFWFKSDTKKDETFVAYYSGNRRGLIVQRDWYGGQRLSFRIYDVSGSEKSIQTGDTFMSSSVPLTHVVANYDRAAGIASLYINGQLAVSGKWGNITAQTLKDLCFGYSPDGAGTLKGVLDEVALYTRPLLPSEVYALFQSGGNGKAPPRSGEPPTVDAGPNQQVAGAGGTCSLAGVVSDDGKPFGDPVVTWSLAAGPAAPTFTDRFSAATTATFPLAGTYLLQLTASDRYFQPVSDFVEVRVGTPSQPPPPGIAAWWPFNGHTREIINGGHDAVLANGAALEAGKVLDALRLDGVNDYAVVSGHSQLDIGSSAAGFSAEFWFRSDVKQDEVFISYYTNQRGLIIHRDWYGGQRLSFRIYNASGSEKSIQTNDTFMSSSVPWTHVAATYDRTSGEARLYINGAKAAYGNWGNVQANTLQNIYFGYSPDGGGSLRGDLDEVSFYNRALSEAEVVSIYNTGLNGKLPPVENAAPVVNAGPDRDAFVGVPISLTGTTSDDGLPKPPASLSCQWSVVSKPADCTVVFGSSSTVATTATFDGAGVYVLRLTASDSVLTGLDEITVTVTAPPSVSPSITIFEPAAGSSLGINTYFEIAATATDWDGTIAKVEFFQDGSKLGEQTLPELGHPTTYFWPMHGGLPAGTYTFTAKATDNTGVTATSAPVSIEVSASPSSSSTVYISTPGDSARISAPTAVQGLIAPPGLASWRLQARLRPPGDDTSGSLEPWMTLASGSAPIGTAATADSAAVPGVIGTLDPTLLVNGLYELRVSATIDASVTTTTPLTLIVEGNMKIGVFSLAFEDLKVPVAGVPITVTRTYDSRDVRVGDFGPGWRLALANVRVQKNRTLGAGWFQTLQSGNGIQIYYVTSYGDRIVTVVMPDGETHRFRAGAYVKNDPQSSYPDNASFPYPATTGQLRFYPIGDTTSKLEPLNASNELAATVYIGGTGDQDLYNEDPAVDLNAQVYNATRFRLTTKDGTVYIVDEQLGLLSLTDLNGNTLVVNRDGQNRVTSVVSTPNNASIAATTVTIHRDATGRVDYIRDPAGKDLDYLYDTQGRLSSFTNRELNVTQFFYENATFPYYLTRIVDPRGVNAIRSEYDQAGKLIKQTDAAGKETVFNHGLDKTGRFEKVKDRLGNETTFYYDDRGNVVQKIDPLGAQTSYAYYPDSDRVKFETDHYGNVKSTAYDAHGNVVVETVGADATEDPAAPVTGHTTRMAYNAQSAPTQITDPDGRTQTFGYDPATNNLVSQTVGAGGTAPSTTTYGYNTDGTLKSTTDALGNLTAYAYNYSFTDAAYPGAVKSTTVTVTDPAGAAGSDTSNVNETILRSTQTLYDAQENQLAQIVTRHLPDGTAQSIVTRYVYDAENRLVATFLPDGRVSETRYTAIGKTDKTADWQSVADYQGHVDANARITTFGYDTRGNATSVTYPDGTTDQTHYDAENRKDWSQDRRGYRTFFVYDADGRLTSTIEPDADDGIGVAAPTSVSDARLSNNPRTTTVYDLAGRVTDTYDETGRHTQTVYFADGTPDASRRKQLVQVRTLGNLVTTYQYDGAGNVRFVTDPRGNKVETRYDDQGRPRFVLYPATDENVATQTETQYDVLGRRTAIIDQEGKVTRYRYDGLGRLIEVRQYLDAATAASDADFSAATSAAGVVSTRYTYDEAGNQTTQTDALGRTTTFWTDALGRRTKRVLPKDSTESAALAETLTYDGWGNLWKRTDFAGKTTTFLYDTLNRLTSKTADPTHPSLSYTNAIARIEYDYDASGARKAARTYNGANTLLYTEATPHDERGRVSYKDTANGRLSYTYYANNLLKDVVSSNAGGVNVGYRYDEVNRLEHVDDATTGTTLTSDYAYNANGSLETLSQPNGISHAYTYDTLNRLRTLDVKVGAAVPGGAAVGTVLHAYNYSLYASGHRKKVIEGAKTTTYTYDELYRLTKETIAGDAHGNTGEIGYDLDKVGNRSNRTSSVTAVPSQLNLSYNARDWLAGDSYDANGSTVQGGTAISAAGSFTDTYDFENRLIVRTKADGSTVNLSYDADGNRIEKNLLDAGATAVATTTWLVDTNNLTGYAQVMEERVSVPSGVTLRTYTYGSQLLSFATSVNAQAPTVRYFGFDGHGNVRELTDSTGAVTDRYDYDAFGNLVFKSGATSNNYLYCGEQFDPDLGLYYNRARYLNTDSGRFWSMDDYEGMSQDPASLHKYLYCRSDAIGYRDPSGRLSMVDIQMAVTAIGTIASIAIPAIQTAAAVAAPYIAAAGTAIALTNSVRLLVDVDYRNQTLSTPAGRVGAAMDIAGAFAGWAVVGKTLSTVSASFKIASRTVANLSKVQRLEIFYRELAAAPPADTARRALKQVCDTLEEVEDMYSGLPRDPMPPKTGTPRMYPPQQDSVIVNADGSLTAKTRAHTIDLGADGGITIKENGTGTVVFQKTGGSQ